MYCIYCAERLRRYNTRAVLDNPYGLWCRVVVGADKGIGDGEERYWLKVPLKTRASTSMCRLVLSTVSTLTSLLFTIRSTK